MLFLVFRVCRWTKGGVSVLFLKKTNWRKEECFEEDKGFSAGCVYLNLNSHNQKQCDVIKIMVTGQLTLLMCYIMYVFSSSEKWIIVMFLIYIFVFYSQMYWWWVDNPLETFTINNKSLWKIPKKSTFNFKYDIKLRIKWL